MDPAGRVALVTGGAAGLGRAVTLALAGRGAKVAFTYLASDEAEAQSTLAEAAALSGSCHGFASDVADWNATDALVQRIERELGPVSILVNNAGMTAYARDPTELSRENWDRVMAVNLGGPFGCIRAVLPSMYERQTGAIVNVASIAGITGMGSSTAYTVSKAALISLTTFLARDLATRGIRVNAVAPGSMPTRWHSLYYPVSESPQTMTPIERVADAVIWLISNDSVTGQIAVVDGGEHLTAPTAERDG